MAKRGLNKVQIIGNLGADPEVKFMPSGDAVCNLTVATSETWKDKQTGEQKEKTDWHRVVIFGKLAEIAGQYLKKGSKVYLEGKLQTRKWQNQSGDDQYTTEVVLQGFDGEMQMLDSASQGQGGFAQQQQQTPQASYQQQPQQNQAQGGFAPQTQQQGQQQQSAQQGFQSQPAHNSQPNRGARTHQQNQQPAQQQGGFQQQGQQVSQGQQQEPAIDFDDPDNIPF